MQALQGSVAHKKERGRSPSRIARLLRIPHRERSREIWHPTLRRKETAMAIFDETYRVVGVESQRLILRGLDSGEVLTVINADPETPITDEDYPLGKIIRLFDPSTQSPN